MKIVKGTLLVLLFSLAACGGCDDDPVDPFFEPEEYGTYEFEADPNIEGPDRIDFGDMAVGESGQRDIIVRNSGREVLKVREWSVSDRFEVSFPDRDAEPEEMMPNEEVVVRVEYEALTNRDTRGELIIGSNDPDTPEFIIRLFANARIPCLELFPSPEVDFGGVDPEESVVRNVEAVNCSTNAETTFRPFVEGDDEFSLDPQVEGSEFTLQPGESTRLSVTFRPAETGVYEGVLIANSNDEFEPVQELALLGRGNAGPCPQAVITASVEGREPSYADPNGTFAGLPLDRVRLTAERSVSDDSRIENYEWSLVGKPIDSGTRLNDLLTGQGKELWLDLAGEYVVELNVIDEEGAEACAPARMRLTATADQDIHIQLVWTTPADPNQSDNNGSDVDLHLLHPLGSWNARPYDCFWRNLEPDWGVSHHTEGGVTVGTDDDPSLDIDDVNGWGPENINLNNPEAGATYDVGVHYFHEHGYSISYATVRIYIGGVLFQEFRRQRLIDQEFWHVARIDWPGGQVHPVGQKYPTFPTD